MSGIAELANPWVGGLSVYEPGRPIEEVARELGLDPELKILKLASNENTLGPSPMAIDAMHQCAADMHRYPDGGSFYLRAALADKLGVSPDQILPGTGSNELLEFLGHVFLSEGKSIVMAERAFAVYRLVAASARASVISVPMVDHVHDLPAMLAAVAPETRIVFIANPNNPTGTMVDQAAIDAFMRDVPDTTLVCFDEAYVELLEPEHQPDVLRYVREGRNVVVLRTFSKTYGLAGLRVGYAIAPVAVIRLLNKVRQPFNVNAMAMHAAVAALGDDGHVARTRAVVSEGLAFFESVFGERGLEYVPSVANFILVRVGHGRTVFEALQREGIIVRPMDAYGMPEYIRITVGTSDENARCIEALDRVLAAGE